MIKLDTEKNQFECEGSGVDILYETLMILKAIMSKIPSSKAKEQFIDGIVIYLRERGDKNVKNK